MEVRLCPPPEPPTGVVVRQVAAAQRGVWPDGGAVCQAVERGSGRRALGGAAARGEPGRVRREGRKEARGGLGEQRLGGAARGTAGRADVSARRRSLSFPFRTTHFLDFSLSPSSL